MRTFFAIELSDNTRKAVAAVIQQLKRKTGFSNIKWTKPEKLHITTRFLGNITNEQYEKITNNLVIDMEPFVITFKNLVLFPTKENPIAIALKPEPISPLIKLNQVLEQAVVACGLKPELRAFLPHLTLGKIKGKHCLELPEVKLPRITISVKHITLFRSETSAEGSHYIPLVCIGLKKTLQ